MPSAKKLRGRQKKESRKGIQPLQPPPQPVGQTGTNLTRAHLAAAPHRRPPTRPGTATAESTSAPTARNLVLTPQAITNIYNIRSSLELVTDFKPVIQVLRLEEKESEFRGKQWHFDLSDGKKFFPGILGRPMLEELAHNSSIEEYSIIRVSKFEVELESFTNGGRYCSIFEAEVVGPNPGRIIGKPIWLADDVLQRIDGMEYRATSYASKVLQQTTVNAEEVRNLLRPRGSGDLPSKLLKRITDGFKEGTRGLQLQLALGPTENCSTIKDSDGITTIHNWFVMLASIAKMNKNYIAASMEMTLRPILNLFLAPTGIVPEKEYYGSTNNYFISVAGLFRIVSDLAKAGKFERSSENDAFFDFACGAVFWNLDRNTNHEVQHALRDVCDTGSALIRHALDTRAIKYQGRSYRITHQFTNELLPIANMRVCPGDSTFCSSLFVLIKEAPSSVEMEHLLTVLRIFVHHDCVDRGMIRNIVELGVFSREHNFLGCWDCLDILYNALDANCDHHGSSDRRMSIAVDAGLIEVVIKMGYEEVEATEAIVSLLERGVTRWSKLCLSMARVDLEELMRLPGVDVGDEGPFSYRIEQLVKRAQRLYTRSCTCCAASLAVGRIFRCGSCGTVYCSHFCQVCVIVACGLIIIPCTQSLYVL